VTTLFRLACRLRAVPTHSETWPYSKDSRDIEDERGVYPIRSKANIIQSEPHHHLATRPCPDAAVSRCRGQPAAQPILTYPTVSGITESKFNTTENINFGDTQSTCLLAEINVSSYAGSYQNVAIFKNNPTTARSGLGDSGITAGIRIPLAKGLMQQCRENAKAFAKGNKP